MRPGQKKAPVPESFPEAGAGRKAIYIAGNARLVRG